MGMHQPPVQTAGPAAARGQDIDHLGSLPERVGDLKLDRATVSPHDSNSLVMALFEANPDIHGVATVEDSAPKGVINRNEFFARFARPYARELFLKRPCGAFANPSPLIIDEATPISAAGAMIADAGEQALTDGCIVVGAGQFMGLCSGVTFVRALSELQGEEHRQLLSSIDYASTIQGALLADSRAALRDRFAGCHELVWRPRDGVGGDCFFASHTPDGVLIGLIDCTGHGVPGALLTSIAISEVGRLSAEEAVRQSPAQMLKRLSLRMKTVLQQHHSDPQAVLQADDGMDAVFVWIDAAAPAARIASAKLPVLIVDDAGGLTTLKGDRKGVGYRDTPADFEWTEHQIPLGGLQRLILATDGLCDQIGGSRGVPFGWSGVRRALAASAQDTLSCQIGTLWSAFAAHQGAESRRDDVTILGLDLDGGEALANVKVNSDDR